MSTITYSNLHNVVGNFVKVLTVAVTVTFLGDGAFVHIMTKRLVACVYDSYKVLVMQEK